MPLPAPAFDVLFGAVIGVPDHGIQIKLAAHDEVALCAVDVAAVVFIEVTAIGEAQIAGEIGRRGQELALGFAIGALCNAVH